MFDIARYNNLLFVVVGFVALLLVGLVFFLKKIRRRSFGNDEPIRAVQNVEPEAHPRNPRIPRVPAIRRRVLGRGVQQDGGESDEEEDNIVEADVKVGAKKLKKLEEKATRKSQREALEQERKEKKIREDNLEKKRKKEEARLEAEEAAKASEEQRKKVEKEKQELEEYLKIKEAFIVEEEGEQAEDEQDEKKVVVLEDLAYYFKIKAQDAIDRIKTLQEEGQLTGVIDDRGKFIYITKDEYEAVAKFIKQRGRVSISELAESMNRLINLNPDNMLRQICMPADVLVDL